MANKLYVIKNIDGEDFHQRMKSQYPNTEVEIVGVGVSERSGTLYDIGGIGVIASNSKPNVSVRIVAVTVDEVGNMKRDICLKTKVELLPDRDGRRYEKFRRIR